MTQEKLYPITVVPQFKNFIELLEKGELTHHLFLSRKNVESPYVMGYEVRGIKPENVELVKSVFKWFNYTPIVTINKSNKYRLRVRSTNLIGLFSGLQFFHSFVSDFVENNENAKNVWSQYITRMEEKYNKQLVSIEEDGDLPF
jgi:hypothetical protein